MSKNRLSFNQIRWIVFILSTIIFVPFLGQVHLFDWDEINFAESAREMLITGNWLEVQIDFQTFWEKPPLFIWMQALSMKLFGVNEFAARFPNAICGIITLQLLLLIGNRLYNAKFAVLWVLVYAGSFLPFFYFKSGIIDPWFNLFMFLGVYFGFLYFNRSGIVNIILSAAFTGLSVLTKGPVGLLIVGLSLLIYLGFMQFKVSIKFRDVLVGILVLIFTGGFWFLLMALNGNAELIVDFIEYQIRLFKTEDAGHGGFFLYHFVVLFFGVFPASIFALRSFYRCKGNNLKSNFRRLMQILFWTVLILFTVVNTKIVHYSSMAYFPITYLAAYTLHNLINQNYQIKAWIKVILGFVGSFYVILIFVFGFFPFLKPWIISKMQNADPFALDAIQTDAGWLGFEFLIGFVLLSGLFLFFISLRKKKILPAIYSLFFSSIIFFWLTMSFVVPRVEKFSQNAAIEFYKAYAGKNVYMRPVGFKSYAHLFYFQKPLPHHELTSDESYLMSGDIDKDAFFVIKIQHLEKYMTKYPEVQEIYRKNGFVFCQRKKKH
jgi:hypothetical protein